MVLAARGARPLAGGRPRSAPALCAAALIAAHVALGDALAADLALDHARGGVAGGIAAALVVLVASHVTGRSRTPGAAAACNHGLGLLCGTR